MIIFMHTKQTNLSLCKEAYWAHYLFLGPSSAPPPKMLFLPRLPCPITAY